MKFAIIAIITLAFANLGFAQLDGDPIMVCQKG